MKGFILLAILAFSCFSFSQTNAAKLCTEIYNNTKTTSKIGNWTKDDDSNLSWIYADTFNVVNRNSAIRGNAKPDTLRIHLAFTDNWSQEKIEAEKAKNKAIIDPLAHKFISALDSIEWKGVKLKKPEFLKFKVLYLPYLRDISKITDEEINTLKKLVRIPDFLVGDVGVFIDVFPDFSFQYIKEIEVDALYYDQLKYVSKDLFKADRVKLGIAKYE